MGLLSQRNEFSSSAYNREELIQWSEYLAAQGRLPPNITFLDYIRLINKALLLGAEQLLENISSVNIVDDKSVKNYLQIFSKFDETLQEYTKCKISTVVKLMEKMEESEKQENGSPNAIEKERLIAVFKKEQEAMDNIHTSLDPIVSLSNLHFQLNRKKAAKENPKGDKPPLQHENTAALISLLQTHIQEAEQRKSSSAMVEELKKAITSCFRIFSEEMKTESQIYDKLGERMDERLNYSLFRTLHYAISTKLLPSITSWILSHLPSELEQLSHLLCIHFAMPHQFQKDARAWFSLCISSELWDNLVESIDDIIHSHHSNVSPADFLKKLPAPKEPTKENKETAPPDATKQKPKALPVKTRPVSPLGPTTPTETPGKLKIEVSQIMELRNVLNQRIGKMAQAEQASVEMTSEPSEDESTENTEEPSGVVQARSGSDISSHQIMHDEKSDQFKNDKTYLYSEGDKKAKRRSKGSGSWRRDRKAQLSEKSSSVKSDNKSLVVNDGTSSSVPSLTLEHIERPNLPLVKPLVVLKFVSEILIHNLEILEKRVKARSKGYLQTIEESIRLFTFLGIKQHQEDIVVHAWLANLSEEYQYIHESYQRDHRRILSLVNKLIEKFSAFKMKCAQSEVSEDSIADTRGLTADVLEIFCLENHITRKQNDEMMPMLDILRLDEQSRIIRAVLDFSPPQYTTHMLPWIVDNIAAEEEQMLFVETIRALVTPAQYEEIFASLRKVLSLNACNSILASPRFSVPF